MKRVLVTGASGFIGRWSLAPLVARGFEVHVADVRGGPATAGVEWHSLDLLASGASASIVHRIRPTHLLHLAWYAAHGLFWTSPENLRWVAASLDLVRAFREAGGQRAVLTGTGAEYDPAHGWCSEASTPVAPTTLYGCAKDALRRILHSYASTEGFSWAWGRVFHLYGPHEAPGRLVPSVIGSLLRGQPARCTHGRQVRDFLHVEDVAAALVALLDSPVEGPVNIASGCPVTLRDVVSTIARSLTREELVRFGDLPAPAGEAPFLVADTRRLHDEVGFVPRFDLERGIDDVVAWARQTHTEST